MNRLYALDYLRGLAASSIMIFHYVSWNLGELDSGSVLGRMGIYGVSVFYVLSGLTLYLVYFNRMHPTAWELGDFVIKRIARIYPLLWLCTLLVIVLNRDPIDLWILVLNFSGLFGFIDWDAGLATGIWSIGNELVFYSFFPLFVFLIKNSRLLFSALVAVITTVYLLFAFRWLSPGLPLSQQWSTYINPLNQVLLFMTGFLIGYFNGIVKNTGVNIAILVISFAILIFLPASGNPITLVTGTNRLLFTLFGVGTCVSFYNLNFHFKNWVGKFLSLLGETSYSIYLIHPIVWTICFSVFKRLNVYLEIHIIFQITFAMGVTLAASYLSYEYFEKLFIRKGKSLTETLFVKNLR
ncbi:MAG TPA: acyltransferase [Chryseolinea sp.]